MDKEKEIEEMTKFILKNRTGEDSEWIANGLYDMGYRKADEVRKETAEAIKNSIINNLRLDNYDYELIDEIFAEYGV